MSAFEGSVRVCSRGVETPGKALRAAGRAGPCGALLRLVDHHGALQVIDVHGIGDGVAVLRRSDD